MERGLSARIKRLTASPIRDMLREVTRPGMVSFAGGLPATSNLPTVDSFVDTETKQETLQYGPSEGESALRHHIANGLCNRGFNVAPSQVIILSGSQQGIDLVAKLVIDEGTTVAVESPTYLAALQAFSLFGAQFRSFDLHDIDATFDDGGPALLYINPTFRNPDGIVYDTTQRHRLATACDAQDTIVFEDDPYRELVYEQCERKPICAGLKHARWIYQSSFSKTLAPGLRLGYLICSPELHPYLLQLKQAADLHSNRLSQHLVLQLLQEDAYNRRLSALCTDYRSRRDYFNEQLTRHLGDVASWNLPVGGLFFWLNLKTELPIDTRELLPQALASGIAFMPGEYFFADGRQAASALRLNFSHAHGHQIAPALKELGNIFRSVLAN